MPIVKMISPQKPPLDFCIEKTYHNVYEVRFGIVEIPEGKYQGQDIDTFRTWQFSILHETVTEAIERIKETDTVYEPEDTLTEKEATVIRKVYDQEQKKPEPALCQHFFTETRQCKKRPLKGKKFCKWHLPKDLIKRETTKRKKKKTKRTALVDEFIPF